ncbi:MAG: Na/Pi cotransporter family protein [Oscillospiraceae bacterium]|nr:Na/Pi cotransporter family protein [Oscillospiraceae bacterium]
MSIFNVFTLLGGLAFFLYGMNIMGDALERKAGSKLKSILANLTSNTFKGFLLGLVVTAVIQSSSATTVMVVGFVNSGIMTLHQAVGVIMGANLGTSVTSWLLSLTGIEGDTFWVQMLKPASFTPLLAFIGIVMVMFIKDKNKHDTAYILIGFAVLMFGMETMSGAVEPLAESEKFQQILLLFSNPVLGLIVGTVFTAIVQSSSASVGILQALTLTGSVTYATAIPIVMGQNIGTCISAMISSIGASKNAKRAAVIHLSFNLISAVICLTVYYLLNMIIGFPFVNDTANPLGIAVVHTVFKIFALALLMPFTKQLEKLSYLIVRDSDEKEKVSLLDERLLSTPPVAVERCRNITFDMAEISVQSLKNSMNLIFEYQQNTADNILKDEDTIDKYEDELGSYLVKLGAMVLSDSDSREVSKLLRIIGDLERISDHSVNILESAKEIQSKNLKFSEPAQKELSVMINAVSDILDMTLEVFRNNDLEKAYEVEPLEQVVDNLQILLKKRHVSRLRKNECTIEMGFVLSDLLTNLERVSDHCSNIAVCMIEIAHESFDTHGYIQELKLNHNNEFAESVQKFSEKYTLESV